MGLYTIIGETGVDIPWFWVAVGVILFLRWVWTQLTTRKPPPQVEEFEEFEEVVEEPRGQRRDLEQKPSRGATSAPAPPPLPTQPTAQQDPGEELRRFLETLAGGPPRAPKPPPPPKKAAPALPVQTVVKAPVLTAEEKAALERLKQRQARPRRRREPASAPGSLRGMLHDRKSLQNAILLKEILDKPRAMRSDW